MSQWKHAGLWSCRSGWWFNGPVQRMIMFTVVLMGSGICKLRPDLKMKFATILSNGGMEKVPLRFCVPHHPHNLGHSLNLWWHLEDHCDEVLATFSTLYIASAHRNPLFDRKEPWAGLGWYGGVGGLFLMASWVKVNYKKERKRRETDTSSMQTR